VATLVVGLKHGGAYKYIRDLLKHKLVHHENQQYDGYRLTPLVGDVANHITAFA
jgi:RIO-like serine/threonine protein kinase